MVLNRSKMCVFLAKMDHFCEHWALHWDSKFEPKSMENLILQTKFEFWNCMELQLFVLGGSASEERTGSCVDAPSVAHNHHR